MRSQRIGHGFESRYLHHIKQVKRFLLGLFFLFLFYVVEITGDPPLGNYMFFMLQAI